MFLTKNLTKSDRVLDLGCGEGFYTYLLSSRCNVIGVDISKKTLDTAKQRYPNSKFEAMRAEDLKFSDSSFNHVYAMDILEHVDDLEAVLAEVTRVLKIDGTFVANIPYWKSEKWLLKVRPSYHEEMHHVRIFKETELEDLLALLGFVLEEKKRTGFLNHIELYYQFKTTKKSDTQLGIGNWRDRLDLMVIHVLLLYFDPGVLTTPLKYVPIWIATIPIGYLIELVGNIFFPKSLLYIFRLKRLN